MRENIQRKHSFFILALFILLLPDNIHSQFIQDPSFEDPGWGNNSWLGCHRFSTPDSQPGVFNNNVLASDGNVYVSLVVRGDKGPYANTTEDLQTELNEPLIAGNCYYLKIDLCMSPTFGHNIGFSGVWLSYANPAVLKIWGGNTHCSKDELLWTSEAVDKSDWETFNAILSPKLTDVNYLILEANYTSVPKYFGNVLVDNVKIEGQIEECIAFQPPNVFTPNGDEMNEYFRIQGLPPNSGINVYNRWGNLIYENENYLNDWNGLSNQGDQLPEGTYYYIINSEFFENPSTGYVQLLR